MGAVVFAEHAGTAAGQPAPQPALRSSRQRSSSVAGRTQRVGSRGEAANMPLWKQVSRSQEQA